LAASRMLNYLQDPEMKAKIEQAIAASKAQGD
jgi:hypothetical protein